MQFLGNFPYTTSNQSKISSQKQISRLRNTIKQKNQNPFDFNQSTKIYLKPQTLLIY